MISVIAHMNFYFYLQTLSCGSANNVSGRRYAEAGVFFYQSVEATFVTGTGRDLKLLVMNLSVVDIILRFSFSDVSFLDNLWKPYLIVYSVVWILWTS